MALVISVSFFLIGITLGFQLLLLPESRPFEQILDVIFVIDIVIKFFTAYTYDVKIVTHPLKIARRYILTFFLFDLISTLPTLLSYQNSAIYFLKILRGIRLAHIITPLIQVLDRINMDKMLKRQLKAFVRLMVILFSAIHILA
jgi:hypothetical protein